MLRIHRDYRWPVNISVMVAQIMFIMSVDGGDLNSNNITNPSSSSIRKQMDKVKHYTALLCVVQKHQKYLVNANVIEDSGS